jgi:hypothetical protein
MQHTCDSAACRHSDQPRGARCGQGLDFIATRTDSFGVMQGRACDCCLRFQQHADGALLFACNILVIRTRQTTVNEVQSNPCHESELPHTALRIHPCSVLL